MKKVLGELLYSIVIGALFSLAMAMPMKDLWLWFLVPLGVDPISTVHGAGLLLLAWWFKSGLARPEKPDELTHVQWVTRHGILSVVAAWMLWLTAYVYHLFL